LRLVIYLARWGKIPTRVFQTRVEISPFKKAGKDTTDLENQIDVMVYKLYELTYNEVKIVDTEFDNVLESFGLSKADYGQMSVAKLATIQISELEQKKFKER